MITGIKCPYCNKLIYLIMGNPAFTYWICINCKKEFEYDIFWERIIAEAPAQNKLLNEMVRRR